VLLLLLLLLVIANLITPVGLLMGRRWLMLTTVELLLLALLRRWAVRVFRTAGYGTGTTAVIGRAVHRSVVHGGSETRVPVLPATSCGGDETTLRHVRINGEVLRVAHDWRISMLLELEDLEAPTRLQRSTHIERSLLSAFASLDQLDRLGRDCSDDPATTDTSTTLWPPSWPFFALRACHHELICVRRASCVSEQIRPRDLFSPRTHVNLCVHNKLSTHDVHIIIFHRSIANNVSIDVSTCQLAE